MFSGLFTPLWQSVFKLWTKQEIWGYHLGLLDILTIFNIFWHFIDQISKRLIKKIIDINQHHSWIISCSPGRTVCLFGGNFNSRQLVATKVLTVMQHLLYLSVCWLVSNRMCAPVMVELEGETDPLQIAMKELK